MSLEANKSYLSDEEIRLSERITYIKEFLHENPSKSILSRVIKGKEYLYLKYRKEGIVVSEYLGRKGGDVSSFVEGINKVKVSRQKAKLQLKKAKSALLSVQKQIKIVEKGLKFGGI